MIITIKWNSDSHISARRINKLLREVEKDLGLIDPALTEWNLDYFSQLKAKYRSDLKILNTYYEEGEILEIGSLPCHMTYCLKQLGYPVVGVDIDPNRTEEFIKKHGLRVLKNDVEKERIAFEDDEFGFVIFSEILEHLRIDPIATLKEINRVLKPGGIMMLTTPNLYSIGSIISFNISRGFNDPYAEFEKLHTVGHVEHVRVYSTNEVRKFLVNTGFEIVDVKYRYYRKLKGIKALLYLLSLAIHKIRPCQITISRKV